MISSAAIASTITQVQVLSSSILANEANSLNLWPEEHSQRRAFRVFSAGLSGDRGDIRCGSRGPLEFSGSRGSHKTLVLPELRKPFRR
jgi:hypothetical protein